MPNLSRRDFLKLGGLSLGSLAFTPSWVICSILTTATLCVLPQSLSVFIPSQTMKAGSFQPGFVMSYCTSYGEVKAPAPEHNPIWYRVWGGYVHRSHLQKVKVIYNQTLPSLDEGVLRLVEVTVPFTQPWRTSKAYGWQQLGFRLYYSSVHWVEAIEAGPEGDLWYRIYDDLTGFPYHINPLHVRPIPLDELTPITPEVEVQNKRIDVNLATQRLSAYEFDKKVLDATISSGIPNGPRDKNGIGTKPPKANTVFRIKCLPSIWVTETFLPAPRTMNFLASRGLASLRRKDMPFTVPTGTIILECR